MRILLSYCLLYYKHPGTRRLSMANRCQHMNNQGSSTIVSFSLEGTIHPLAILLPFIHFPQLNVPIAFSQQKWDEVSQWLLGEKLQFSLCVHTLCLPNLCSTFSLCDQRGSFFSTHGLLLSQQTCEADFGIVVEPVIPKVL